MGRVADVAGAMSLEALRGTPAAFDERIHRPHTRPPRFNHWRHRRMEEGREQRVEKAGDRKNHRRDINLVVSRQRKKAFFFY
jgi:histidine ammonia-lyase